MKAKELQGFSVEELEKKSLELSQELFNLKFQLHTGHLENTARFLRYAKILHGLLKLFCGRNLRNGR